MIEPIIVTIRSEFGKTQAEVSADEHFVYIYEDGSCVMVERAKLPALIEALVRIGVQ